MQIIQIVSRLPPAIDGVGDYACLLARQLRAAHDIHTVFVVCDPAWKKSEIEPPSTAIGDFPIHQLKEHSVEELLRTLSQPGMPATVLLQFVGYGYQKRGCPAWLARGLRAWKKDGKQKSDSRLHPERRLLTMFHELYADGPLWSSAFWTSPVQKWIAKSLARISEHCFTNLTVNARILKHLTARSENDFTVLPVFSNVGEPENLPAWNARKPRLIVFGSAGQRRKVYFECKASLEKTCRSMKLDEIIDIGAPFELPPLSVRVFQRGILPASEVSREMLAARAGFFAYPTAYLGKSGIFAAYAAHGLLPVTFEASPMKNEDALNAGEHFLQADDPGEANAEKIATGAGRWYQANGTKNLAGRFASIIQKSNHDLKPGRTS
jgi:hypothetical protein